MPFAITQSCCSDASCVTVCPVDCIHPTPDEPDFGRTEMLYVDPRSCIDCGACADACPVDAIFPVESLSGPQRDYAAINADYFAERPTTGPEGPWEAPVFPASLSPRASGLRVAIVGTGPSAGYTASALLTTAAEVTMIDRLQVPGGLVRFGVAPDHRSTKAIGDRFATVRANPRLRLHLGVEVGTDVSHEALLAHHDAVVYAVGATSDRQLGVPGEDLPGVLPARTYVGWYNGHPEVAADAVDLAASHRLDGASGRLVVVGNGNVALDVARVTLGDPGRLADTDAAAHAIAALHASRITEVVLVARRGPEAAAYSLSEVRALLTDPDLEVVLAAPDPEAVADLVAAAAPGSKAAALQGLPVRSTAGRPAAPPAPGQRRRLVLVFHTVVDHIVGSRSLSGIELAPAPGAGPGPDSAAVSSECWPADLVLRSVGYRSEALPALPFDATTATVPHEAGRVVDPVTSRVVPATYVVGWIKRGPRGGIGSNRVDAAETVASIVADANAGRLTVGRGSHRAFARLVRTRTR